MLGFKNIIFGLRLTKQTPIMKTRFFYGLSLLMLMFATSCNFTERVTVKDDGSGQMSLEIDASQLMAMAGDEMAKQGEERKDSTFTFKEILDEKRDSIAKLPKADQERLKKLENFKVHMMMDPKTSEFKMDIFTDFQKAEDITDIMQAFSELNKMNKAGGAPSGMSLEKKESDVKYFYDGKKFVKTIKPAKTKEEEKSDEDAAGEEMMKSMFEESTYTVIYQFPKPVKSVSDKSAVISDDKKTVTVTYSLLDYFDKPEDMGLEVKF